MTYREQFRTILVNRFHLDQNRNHGFLYRKNFLNLKETYGAQTQTMSGPFISPTLL